MWINLFANFGNTNWSRFEHDYNKNKSKSKFTKFAVLLRSKTRYINKYFEIYENHKLKVEIDLRCRPTIQGGLLVRLYRKAG